MSKKYRLIFGALAFITLALSSAFGSYGGHLQQITATPTPMATVFDESTPNDFGESQFEAYSQFTPTPLPEIKEYDQVANFTFKDIGQENIVLHYLEIYEMELDLPNQWNISYPNSYLDIHYDLFEDAQDNIEQLDLTRDINERPPIEIYVNGRLADIFHPKFGKDHHVQIDLPYLLEEDRPFNVFNTYTIEFQYLNDYDDWCDYEGVLTIHEDSKINLLFNEVGVKRDLADFPRPLVQDSFLPETLHFIIPDEYDEVDLNVLAKTASAIGRGTFGNLKFNVMQASEVTPSILANSNAVIIGKPGDNSFLSDLYEQNALPTELSSDNFSILGLSDADDGVLQLIPAVNDSKHSYLIISANSDRGILTAVEALSDMPIGMSGTKFVVSSDGSVDPEAQAEHSFTRTFSQLGFTSQVSYGLGRDQMFISFYTPRDWKIKEGSRIILDYGYSNNISYTNSVLNVYVNEVPVASAVFDDEMGEKRLSIPLEKDHIIIGARNIIRIEASIGKVIECALYDPRSSWMSILDSSILHVPYELVDDAQELMPIVHPMEYLVTEKDILFSLPSKPSKHELEALAHISFLLGRRLRSDQSGYDFKVSLDPAFDPSTYKNANMIFLGRPTQNDAIAKLNDFLPQPFVSGEDVLAAKQADQSYRVQGDVSIGLIQALPAPWNPFRAVTVITGTTEEGVNWAIDGAINPDEYFRLGGDVIFVRENEIEAFQSSFPIYASLDDVLSTIVDETVVVEENKPSDEEVVTLTPNETITDRYVQEKSASQQQERLINLYLVSGVILLGLLVAVFGIIRTVRGGRRR